MNTNLALLNTYSNLPVESGYADYAGGPWVINNFIEWEKEHTDELNELAASLEPFISELGPGENKPVVLCKCSEGGLANAAMTITENNEVEMIVMGARAGSALDHALTGSDTSTIINNATRPVLIIPPTHDLKRLKRVVFATDHKEADIKAIHYLVKLAKLFGFHLDIVHVHHPGEHSDADADKEMLLLELEKLRYPAITFKEIGGTDVVRRLNVYCKETHTDLLTMVHYHNSFFARLFKQSASEEALTGQTLPLLIFPARTEKNYQSFV